MSLLGLADYNSSDEEEAPAAGSKPSVKERRSCFLRESSWTCTNCSRPSLMMIDQLILHKQHAHIRSSRLMLEVLISSPSCQSISTYKSIRHHSQRAGIRSASTLSTKRHLADPRALRRTPAPISTIEPHRLHRPISRTITTHRRALPNPLPHPSSDPHAPHSTLTTGLTPSHLRQEDFPFPHSEIPRCSLQCQARAEPRTTQPRASAEPEQIRRLG